MQMCRCESRVRSGVGKGQPSEGEHSSHPDNISFVPRAPPIGPGDEWGFEDGSAHDSSSAA